MAEVEFRDGKKTVPDHLRDLMVGLDTHKFTLEEAKQLAEKKLVRDRLNQIQTEITMRHFRENS